MNWIANHAVAKRAAETTVDMAMIDFDAEVVGCGGRAEAVETIEAVAECNIVCRPHITMAAVICLKRCSCRSREVGVNRCGCGGGSGREGRMRAHRGRRVISANGVVFGIGVV